MNIRKRTWTWQGAKAVAWQLDSNDGGKRRQKQFRTRQEAELYRDKLIRERYAREYDVLLEASFADFLKIYVAKKPWRTDSYRERVMSALKLMPFEKFPTTEAIEHYRDERLKTVEENRAGVEMECGALFTLAALRGITAVAVLVASDPPIGGRQTDLHALRAGHTRAARLALDYLATL